MNIFVAIGNQNNYCRVADDFNEEKFQFYVYNGMWGGTFDKGTVTVHHIAHYEPYVYENCRIIDESEIEPTEASELKSYSDPDVIKAIMESM